MRIALLSNPDAGSGRGPEVERLLGDHGAEVRSFALDEGDAVLAWGPARLAVAGGDGTLGAAAAVAARAGMPLAVVPVGTANDFARATGIPLELEAACRLAARGSGTRRLDMAWMDDRPFLNAASIGLSPVAADRARGLKRALGPLAYAAGAVRAGLTAKPVRCRLVCDGEPLLDGPVWQASVAVTGAFGGGAELDADPRDGRLDAVAIAAGSRVRLAVHAYGMRLGRLESQRGVRAARVREVELDTGGAVAFNVDGEIVEAAGARFRIEPGALELVDR